MLGPLVLPTGGEMIRFVESVGADGFFEIVEERTA
jgi:hypothetical protein